MKTKKKSKAKEDKPSRINEVTAVGTASAADIIRFSGSTQTSFRNANWAVGEARRVLGMPAPCPDPSEEAWTIIGVKRKADKQSTKKKAKKA